MNSVCRELFRAIHEGLWVSIEYKNQEEKITKYWIGIRSKKEIFGCRWVASRKFFIARINYLY